ncbi:MAG: LmbE family N-acetylglucosaminyl deacetylase [Limisphaerales bacterium]|jgi:LmbE family N-acetylglucosaminyl deacetylase
MNSMSNFSNALVLAPHPDDGEFGCGATLKRLAEQGTKVWYAAFSPCIKSLPEGSADDRLFGELNKAAAHLGIPEDQIMNFDFEVREFPRDRQKLLETLIRLRKDINPELVLMPNSDDVHQDHNTVYQEGLRAFKHSSLIGYELPWNNLQFKSNFHCRVEETHLDAKVDAIYEYESQRFRAYSDRAFIKGVARMRGLQIGSEFAEAFELIRWIV